MFVHSVYFWLKPTLTSDEKNQIIAGLRSLTTISSVRQSFIGTPASTDRPVIDRSYQYSLILHFDDKAGHDSYQTHAVHEQFRNECGGFWDRVLIYDAVS